MNLESFENLQRYLKDNGYDVKQKYKKIGITEVQFSKEFPTDDNDVKLKISGTFDWCIKTK